MKGTIETTPVENGKASRLEEEPPDLKDPVRAAAEKRSPSRREVSPTRKRLSILKERLIETLLLLSACSSVAITLGIVGTLIYESSTFFAHVTLRQFFTDTLWTPLFASPHFGISPLVMGTLVTTIVALVVALPVGTICAR
jgi:phosphate transport system permease protein